jgi:hypothetical protein
MFSDIQTYSISKLGVHHDLTLNKFECTPFKNIFSNIQTYSSLSSKLGVHHDLTLNKFQCTPFKTMTNSSKDSI